MHIHVLPKTDMAGFDYLNTFTTEKYMYRK